MAEDLRGRFRIVNRCQIQKKAENIDDPRHVFYQAMLASGTYAEYLARAGSIIVQPETTAYSVSGEMEIRYVRNRRPLPVAYEFVTTPLLLPRRPPAVAPP